MVLFIALYILYKFAKLFIWDSEQFQTFVYILKQISTLEVYPVTFS